MSEQCQEPRVGQNRKRDGRRGVEVERTGENEAIIEEPVIVMGNF